jgi:ABC-type branched-subunit amino acid transport system ATPase component/uncharacterized protein YjbI with pentapeptide repeats
MQLCGMPGPTTMIAKPRRRLSHTELHKIIKLHGWFLSGRSGGARALLAFTDLSELAMAGCNLSEADLSGAVLRGAHLYEAKLDRATLFGADLRDADLQRASLTGANLRGASLRGANLTGADLFKADLRSGSIATKDLKGNLFELTMDVGPAELDGARLVNANLTEADISDAMARHTDFTDAIMRNAKLLRANMQNATLSGADLEGADLSAANLRGANLQGAILTGSKTDLTDFHGASLQQVLTDKPAGKLAGLVPPASGTIEYAGRDIAGLAAPDIARLGIGYVPQGRGMFAGMSVRENLALGRLARATDGRDGVVWNEAKIFECFPRLAERMDVAADYLSGGEQQMVAVARALSGNVKLLLLDEPFEGLAPTVIQELFTVFDKLRQHTSVVIVEHNLDLVLALADRVFALERGAVFHQGPAAPLLHDLNYRKQILWL